MATTATRSADGSGAGQVSYVSDGLISPAQFEPNSYDLKIEEIEAAAAATGALGTDLKETVHEIAQDWRGLQACYEAPEQEQVYSLLDPAAEASSDVMARLTSAEDVLELYAENVASVKTRLEDLESRAVAFRGEALRGYTTIRQVSPHLPPEEVTESWRENTAAVAKNAALVQEYEALIEELEGYVEATTTKLMSYMSQGTAKALSEEFSRAHIEAIEAANENPPGPPPWGWAAEEDRNCHEQVADGIVNVVNETATGIRSLVGRGDIPAGEAWLGMLDGIGSVVMIGLPSIAGKALHSAGVTNPVTTFLANRHDTGTTVLAGMAAIDLTAEDPLAKWKQAPIQAATEAVINIGSNFVPVGGWAKTGLSMGLTGTRLGVKVAGRAAAISGKVGARIPGGKFIFNVAPRIHALSRLDLDEAFKAWHAGRRVLDGRPLTGHLFPPARAADEVAPARAASEAATQTPRSRRALTDDAETSSNTDRAHHPDEHVGDKPDIETTPYRDLDAAGRHQKVIFEYRTDRVIRDEMHRFAATMEDLSPSQSRALLHSLGDDLPPGAVRDRLEAIASRPERSGGVTPFDVEQVARTTERVDALVEAARGNHEVLTDVFGRGGRAWPESIADEFGRRVDPESIVHEFVGHEPRRRNWEPRGGSDALYELVSGGASGTVPTVDEPRDARSSS